MNSNPAFVVVTDEEMAKLKRKLRERGRDSAAEYLLQTLIDMKQDRAIPAHIFEHIQEIGKLQ